ncbi:TraB/GumN family protein [Comamonas sp. Y33R10-2]|uniref:TraB/GumN family protein n=1 Tax=Comamonas sp. Y33R10-2 TaxID=2853257 RepID=UPI002104D768|nr:TraB/GumN family protein [Comamonas sp. Y33R10-2]
MNHQPACFALRRPLLAQALTLVLSLAAACTSGFALAASPAHGVKLGGKAAAITCPVKPQMPTEAELKVLAAQAQDRGMLWRVTDSKANGARASWLYGTIHVGKREWMVPGRSILRAVQGADQLALELNLLDPSVGQELLQGLKAQASAPPLATDLKQRLAKQLKLACAEDLAAMRPEAQVLGLLAKTGSRQGLNAEYGVDITLAGMAHALGKPITGLESVQAQLKELVSDDPVEIAETVSDGLKQLEGGMAPEMMQLLAQVWASGNARKLENYADWCDCANTERERAQLKRLIDDRNPGMADGIAALLDQGKTVFAAVGALHMVGPVGLPELLRKKGYRVERVDFMPSSDHRKLIKSMEAK